MKQRIATVLSVALTVGVLASPVLAQRPGGGPGGPGGPGGRPGFGGRGGGFGMRGGRGQSLSLTRLPESLQARLGLSAAQKKKLDAIGDGLRSEMQGMFGGGGGGDRQAAFAKMREKSERAEKQAEAVLDNKQKKTYASLKAEAREYEGLGRSSVALLAVKDLKPDQKKRLKVLAKTAGEKRGKLFAGGPGGGPGGPGGGPGGPGGGFEGMRALEQENQAAVKRILSPAQQKQYENALPRRGGGPGGPGGFGGPGGGRPGGPGGPGGRGPGGGRPGGPGR